ncbi:uncharacterized protein ASPGLDRAFT_1491855 [Aspergillus glaucus CBS 516.65]|uniref:Uncharacterized protein n=1 Tax=Aspergillus glaucus CBS 516.65 TaxID=1160497 RepID=A0A1L9VIP1_ASPGL|nr:hypothetical protein ASPGLDRAFT_1491855 [Aspergillus glaucus CBS 516.65]OJJ83764.1 hypothetical protein ASPGLDRAFT_1491855 [Aspergillus glaucus CBS 516.65]
MLITRQCARLLSCLSSKCTSLSSKSSNHGSKILNIPHLPRDTSEALILHSPTVVPPHISYSTMGPTPQANLNQILYLCSRNLNGRKTRSMTRNRQAVSTIS